jgi:hypothetical protein
MSVKDQDEMCGQTVVLCLKGREGKIAAPKSPGLLLLSAVSANSLDTNPDKLQEAKPHSCTLFSQLLKVFNSEMWTEQQ